MKSKNKRVGRPTARIAAKDKSDYIRLKIRYLEKRKFVKENLKIGDPKRTRQLEIIRDRIFAYTRAIKRFDVKFGKLRFINKKVKDYYGFSMYQCKTNWGNSVKSRKPIPQKRNLVRRMFCKYCIEARIGSRYIGLFLGIKATTVIPLYRRELNELIKDEEYLKKWRVFKKVVNE